MQEKHTQTNNIDDFCGQSMKYEEVLKTWLFPLEPIIVIFNLSMNIPSTSLLYYETIEATYD